MFSLRSLKRRLSRSLKRRGTWGTFKRVLEEPFWVLLEYRPSQIRWKLKDKEFDRRFGVDTSGRILPSALDLDDEKWHYASRYQPTDPKYFKTVVGELPIQHERFTFIDLGSGKGRVLLLAAEFPFRRILGVEISQSLHEIAQRNIRSYRNPAVKCATVELLCADAANYQIPHDPEVIYFFNPFEKRIMTQVLSNIGKSFREQPGEIYIVYNNPVLGALFDQASCLRKIRTEQHYAVYLTVNLPAGDKASASDSP